MMSGAATGGGSVKCDACQEEKPHSAQTKWYGVPGDTGFTQRSSWTICIGCSQGDTRWIHHAIYPWCMSPRCDMWDIHKSGRSVEAGAPPKGVVVWASDLGGPEPPPWPNFPHCPSCHRRLWAANRLIRGPHPAFGTCPHCNTQVINRNEGTTP